MISKILACSTGTLRIEADANWWARVTVETEDKPTNLGAESYRYVVGHLVSFLKNPSPTQTWVMSLSEEHFTAYGLAQGDGVVIQFQNPIAQFVTDLTLSAAEREIWLAELVNTPEAIAPAPADTAASDGATTQSAAALVEMNPPRVSGFQAPASRREHVDTADKPQARARGEFALAPQMNHEADMAQLRQSRGRFRAAAGVSLAAVIAFGAVAAAKYRQAANAEQRALAAEQRAAEAEARAKLADVARIEARSLMLLLENLLVYEVPLSQAAQFEAFLKAAPPSLRNLDHAGIVAALASLDDAARESLAKAFSSVALEHPEKFASSPQTRQILRLLRLLDVDTRNIVLKALPVGNMSLREALESLDPDSRQKLFRALGQDRSLAEEVQKMLASSDNDHRNGRPSNPMAAALGPAPSTSGSLKTQVDGGAAGPESGTRQPGGGLSAPPASSPIFSSPADIEAMHYLQASVRKCAGHQSSPITLHLLIAENGTVWTSMEGQFNETVARCVKDASKITHFTPHNQEVIYVRTSVVP